jgi:CRP/FNR family transcriptional regulator, nitrogen oxide reductase regulator
VFRCGGLLVWQHQRCELRMQCIAGFRSDPTNEIELLGALNDKDGEMKTESGARRVMTGSEIAARVSELAPEFLRGLAPDDLAIVLEAATLRRFPAHSIIAREGDFADELFLVIGGRARTFTTTRRGEKVLLLRISAGEGSGGRALMARPMEYLVSTEAVTDCSALAWSRTVIRGLTKQYPILLDNALMIASDYLAAYRDMHVAASYHTASQRVARVLGRLAGEVGRRGFEGTVINISNEELANETNVTIFTVSRMLAEWQKKGLVVKRRGQIVVRSPEDLVRIQA